eukprot:9232733-Alexandrium_andersonii.AAC.1
MSAPGTDESEAQRFKGSAPSWALHVDIEVPIEEAVAPGLSSLDDRRRDLGPPRPSSVVAVNGHAGERRNGPLQVGTDPIDVRGRG